MRYFVWWTCTAYQANEGAEVAEHDPPEAAGADGPGERPFRRRPGGIDDVRARCAACRSRRTVDAPSGSRPISCGLRRTKKFSGPSTRSTSRPMAQHEARQPSLADDRLQPGQQHDGADADAGEGDADGQAAAAHEPVGKEQRLRGEGHEVGAAADQHAERRIELPGLLDRRAPGKARPPAGTRRSRSRRGGHGGPSRGPRSGSGRPRPGSRRRRRRRRGRDASRTRRSAAAAAARRRCAR